MRPLGVYAELADGSKRECRVEFLEDRTDPDGGPMRVYQARVVLDDGEVVTKVHCAVLPPRQSLELWVDRPQEGEVGLCSLCGQDRDDCSCDQ